MARRKKPASPAVDPLDVEGEAPSATYIPPPAQPQPAAFTFSDTQRLKRLVAELSGRSAEALRLYEPLPVINAFHADERDERLLRGSNRAGKTLGAAAEVARAVTAQDPFGKFPEANGRAFLIGLNEQHLADVMHRKLFRAGAFKMIRDRVSGAWRAFRPVTDAGRDAEAKPAPPLVPPRFVAETAWKDKKRGVPAFVRLKNGWELTFFSSNATPPNGVDIDLWWIDEECQNEAWYAELAARVLDRHGVGVWSATPQVASVQLYDLHVRHEEGDPNVGEHVALLSDNPHITQEEKDKLASKILSEEERRVRIFGEFALTGFKVYPDFHLDVHGMDWDGPIPLDWSLYLAVDPGRQVCAVLFLAVPPPDRGLQKVILYDELYIKNCDAARFGSCVAAKTGGRVYEAMVIDSRAGRVMEMGSGLNVEMQYAQALAANKVKTRRGGVGFLWGADDPKAGIEAVRQWLRIREDGTPTLRVLRGRLPAFKHEIERYHYRRVQKLVSDEPEKKNDHLMDCLRYLAMLQPRYVKPPRSKGPENYAVAALKRKKDKKREGRPDFVRLGPGKV